MNKALWILHKAASFCFPYILVNVIMQILTAILPLGVTFLNKEIVNELENSIGTGKISTLFIGLVIAYMIMYFVNLSGGFLRAWGHNFYKLNVDSLFHRIFMWKCNNTPQERFFDSEFMERFSFVSKNSGKISGYINNLTELVFSNISTLTGAIALFAVYEPLLIIYALLIAVLTVLMYGYFSKKEYELDKKQVKKRRKNGYYKSILTEKKHAKELRTYKLRDYFYNKWVTIHDELRIEKLSLSLKKIDYNNVQSIIKFLFRAIAIGVLLLGIYLQKYDLGTFVMLFGLIDTCASRIDSLARTIMGGTFKDTKYLNDYYDFVAPISNEEIRTIQKKKSIVSSELPYGTFEELKAKNVSYQYPQGTENAVCNVNFSIKKGEIISILGYNGSGKTTLSKLLSGSLFPQSGTITINGIPVTEKNKDDIFLYFGIAPQEFPHFSLPLREVVGLGRIEKMDDRAELDLAYERTGLTEFISRYSKGEDIVLGKEYDEEGIDLSGGEWQRLIIASAYMGQPEVLILDEPTASIDPLKEMEMIRNFRKNLEGKTAILISHRIGFARLADRIVMMNDGKIAEQGTHNELLSQNGVYAKLFYEQKKLYEEVNV